MIKPEDFYNALEARGVGFYTGVPDSLLANFCAYVDDHGAEGRHLISANEGNAIALATGFHLATGGLAAVYMQNSGLGNAVNPLVSLADAEVYKIPMILIVGWRGEPGVKDEPQHVKQGQITEAQLSIMGIPYWIVDPDTDLEAVLDAVFASLSQRNAPIALVIRKGVFSGYSSKSQRNFKSAFSREEALETLLALCGPEDLIVSTTGKTSREVFELREKNGQTQKDFLTVGGMGHTLSIALGVAIGRPERKVICLDGDGSLLMHMGAMPVAASVKPKNLVHVLLNNQSHESVGGQPTCVDVVDFGKLAESISYVGYAVAHDAEGLSTAWEYLASLEGPVLLEIKIRNGSRSDLGRPSSTAEENKKAFMRFANAN